MIASLTVLHVIVCFVLIAVVLLQRGKGAEMGAVFGGGASSTVFGSRGAGTFLSKLTTGCAVIFMATSLSLSYLVSQSTGDRLFQDEVEESAPENSPFENLGTVVPEEPSLGAVAPEEPSVVDNAPAAESDTSGVVGGEAVSDTPQEP